MDKDDRRPKVEMIEKAWKRNDDGGGIAYREDGEVIWNKGLDLDEMKYLCADMPVPYIAHFRRASSGGIRPSLTHPFPISYESSVALTGSTKGCVLFHNGDWKEWAPEVRWAALHKGVPIPVGKWSDSRGMAFLCSIYGHGYMELLEGQKGVAFGPETLEIFAGKTGWLRINDTGTRVIKGDEPGIWCSNDHFLEFGNNRSNGISMCLYEHCQRKDLLDTNLRCPQHPKHLDGVPYKPALPAPPVAMSTPVGTPVVSQAQPAPFRLVTQGTTTPRPLISLEMAELMHKRGSMSKNLLKAIRKAYTRVDMGGKAEVKAKKDLSQMSNQLFLNGRLQ